ncbi:MAG TPA: energy transducer TonB [Pyrinomonadaceae bacterium]|nr:energy transducer TonB [Pyrinomonadaceae bacterium]
MRDKKETQPFSTDDERRELDETEELLASEDDDELKAMLLLWRAPEPPALMDKRVANAYRREISQTPHESEVTKMKRCSICQEEFADKFSFCPVDGTPLSEPVAEANVIVSEGFDEDAAATLPPGYSPEAQGAAVRANEYHLTIIEERTIVGRLSEELREFAHDAQLSWPEFKRDPIGFTRRGIAASGVLVWKFVTRPNVAVALISAVMVMLVIASGIMLLERSQSTVLTKIVMVALGVIFLVLAGVIASSLPNRYRSLSTEETAETKNMALAGVAAFAFILFLVGGFYGIDRYRRIKQEQIAQAQQERLTVEMVDIPQEEEEREPGAAGAGKGTGGGLKPKQEKAGGGGGGGDEAETRQASAGKLPTASLEPQIVVPRPEPPPSKAALLPVTPTVRADPTLFPPDTRNLPYGMPDSKSTELSRGSGSGEGYGGGSGTGVGRGEGAGVGPGRGYNTGGGDTNLGGGGTGGGPGGPDRNRVYTTKDVTSKARILSRPEPQYTEEARRNQVTGTVVLRAVFSAGGAVTNIKAVKGLPDGLTEKAIAAARQIKFVPAQKDGVNVSQYIQIEYNFNLY